jgi:N-acetylmuramoyl-L-alanine amidase
MILEFKMRLLTAFSILVLSFSCLAQPVQILDMRFWKPAHHHLRLVFELSAPVTHNIFTLKSPYRLVIDLKNTKLLKRLVRPSKSALVKNIRSAPRNLNNLRVVLDLKAPVRTKSFLLKPNDTNKHRLVIDINTLKRTTSAVGSKKSKTLARPSQHTVSKQTQAPTGQKKASSGRDIVIAIDAGHGGIDSGAIGLGGTMEKDVALAIARDLAALVAKERGMRAVLIRNGDYFLSLGKRLELARQYQADLFISLHADAYPDDNTIQGTSVYMLSRSGASSEAARWLAEKENAANLIGGVSLSDKDGLLAQVLLDLSQAGTLEASAYIGQKVLKALRKVSKIHFFRVQRANFMVLRSPDIPSILVETGFISSPREEKKLSNPNYRRRMAVAIMAGIREYFASHAPPDTLLARR